MTLMSAARASSATMAPHVSALASNAQAIAFFICMATPLRCCVHVCVHDFIAVLMAFYKPYRFGVGVGGGHMFTLPDT
jgi:hypothetical protein